MSRLLGRWRRVRVASSYLIQETRRRSNWKEVKALLEGGLYKQHRHVEILIHPYAKNGEHKCVVFRRDAAPAATLESPEEVGRNVLAWLATLPITRDAIIFFIQKHPEGVPGMLDQALESLVSDKPFTRKSYQIFNIGAPNNFKALSGEYAFGLDRAFDAVDAFLETIAENRKKGWVQSSPISLRFVKKSSAYLSMMSGRDTMMIETPILRGSPGIEESLKSYEDTARRFGGRPHWGQMHSLTGMPGWLSTEYANFDSWLEVFMQLNHKGIFNNAFTDRIGISKMVAR